MKIESVNVTIMISDLDKSIHFYIKALGFSLKNRYGNHWADIDGPGISIGLHPTNKDFPKGNNIQIGIKVDNLKSTLAELEGKGISYKLNQDDNIQIASLIDPDGNNLFIVQ